MTPIWAMGLMVVISFFSALATFSIKVATPTLHRKLKTLLNFKLFTGLFLYGISMLMSLVAFKFGELSVLYPFVALQYVWTSLLSMKYLDEEMNWKKWAGIGLIFVGVSLIGLGA